MLLSTAYLIPFGVSPIVEKKFQTATPKERWNKWCPIWQRTRRGSFADFTSRGTSAIWSFGGMR